MPGWVPEQDLDLVAPGAAVTVATAAPQTAPLELSAVVAADGGAAAVAWHPLQVLGAVADPVPVAVRWGDDLGVGVVAGAGWRIAQTDPLDLVAVEPDRPLLLRRADRPLHGQVETAAYVLPAASLDQDGGDWARVDLRLMVHAGRPAVVQVDGLPWDDLRVPAGWAATRSAAAVALTPAAPWRGERLLRLEGRLRPGATAVAPAVRLVDAAGQGVPAAPPFLVLQSGGLAEVAAAGDSPRSEDDLPAWTRPIPGAAVVAVERSNQIQAPWRWSTLRRPLAAMPAGVVADAQARIQVAPDGMRLWWRASVAAPGVDAVPLTLPAGATLRAATCDGRPAVIRTGTPPRLVLPGGTRTTVCLLLDLPAPGAALALAAPDLGLAVTGTRWQVAVDGALIARPVAAADAVALSDPGEVWPPGPLGIRPARTAVDEMPRPATSVVDQDPRRLRPAAAPAPVEQEPILDLRGVITHGHGGGAPLLRLTLAEREALRADQRVGWVLAAILGLLLGWRWRARAAALVAIAAVVAAAALRLLGETGGPWVPALDLLPVALLLGVVLARIRRWNDLPCAP
jgi:hypothetical protein